MKWKLHPSLSFAAVMGLLASNGSQAAELRPETVSAWQQYVQGKDATINLHVNAPELVSDDNRNCTFIRSAKIVVVPARPNTPLRVPNGLIHDWIATVFIPNTTLPQVLATVRDYDRYKDVYHPGVVDSKLVNGSDEDDRFSLVLMNTAFFTKKAIEGEYSASYIRTDDHHWYSVTQSTRVQEIEDYGGPNQRLLPAGQGTGLIWRVHTITRYDEQDEGVFLQMEAIILSRDVPSALRWIVDPIVRRVSRDSLQQSLRQTREAVQSNLARVEASPLEKTLVTNQTQHVR